MSKRILVVEDEPDLAELMKSRLDKTGYSVEVALDGEEALAKFDAHKPDLVLLDIMMPKIDGKNVCRVIRSNPSNRDIPIMVVTGMGKEDIEKICYELGADDFIEKPFETHEFVDRVRSLLG